MAEFQKKKKWKSEKNQDRNLFLGYKQSIEVSCRALSPSMALPQKIQRQFSPEEIQFIAGNEFISIIPNFTLDKMEFIQVHLRQPSPLSRAARGIHTHTLP
jgi:hypothetical protein